MALFLLVVIITVSCAEKNDTTLSKTNTLSPIPQIPIEETPIQDIPELDEEQNIEPDIIEEVVDGEKSGVFVFSSNGCVNEYGLIGYNSSIGPCSFIFDSVFKSVQFDFMKKEKTTSVANIVSVAKDVFNLKNNWSENDSNEIKFYIQNLIKSIATKNVQKEE
jgi:hypothetical protein